MHGTVVSYLSGVKTLHKLVGADWSAFHAVSLKLTLRGLRKTNDPIPRQAAPLTPAILEEIYDKLDMGTHEDALFWGVLILAFFLLFRKSNLIPDTKNGFDVKKQLTWGDLKFFPDRVECKIRWMKTNQFRDEELIFPLPC